MSSHTKFLVKEALKGFVVALVVLVFMCSVIFAWMALCLDAYGHIPSASAEVDEIVAGVQYSTVDVPWSELSVLNPYTSSGANLNSAVLSVYTNSLVESTYTSKHISTSKVIDNNTSTWLRFKYEWTTSGTANYYTNHSGFGYWSSSTNNTWDSSTNGYTTPGWYFFSYNGSSYVYTLTKFDYAEHVYSIVFSNLNSLTTSFAELRFMVEPWDMKPEYEIVDVNFTIGENSNTVLQGVRFTNIPDGCVGIFLDYLYYTDVVRETAILFTYDNIIVPYIDGTFGFDSVRFCYIGYESDTRNWKQEMYPTIDGTFAYALDYNTTVLDTAGNTWYLRGYNAGVAVGAESAEGNTILDVVWGTFQMPFTLLFGSYDTTEGSDTYHTYVGGLFNFTILGIDLRPFVLSIMTLCVVIGIVRLILGARG